MPCGFVCLTEDSRAVSEMLEHPTWEAGTETLGSVVMHSTQRQGLGSAVRAFIVRMIVKESNCSGLFPGCPVVKTVLPLQGAWILYATLHGQKIGAWVGEGKQLLLLIDSKAWAH